MNLFFLLLKNHIYIMEQSINYKLKIDFLISNNIPTYISQSTKNKNELKGKRKMCEKYNQSNKRKKQLDESHKICYKSNILYKPSGNKVVDNFIRYIQTN